MKYSEKCSVWTLEQFLVFPMVLNAAAIRTPDGRSFAYDNPDDFASKLLDADMKGWYVSGMEYFSHSFMLEVRLTDGKFAKSNIPLVVERATPKFA